MLIRTPHSASPYLASGSLNSRKRTVEDKSGTPHIANPSPIHRRTRSAPQRLLDQITTALSGK
jgi:hypothetical protein